MSPDSAVGQVVVRHSIYTVIIEQSRELESDERYHDALHLLYQGVRWAAADSDWWERLSILSFVMTATDWPVRQNLAHTHLSDMGFVNALLYLKQAMTLAPERARLQFFWGWFHFVLLGDQQLAREAFDVALCLEPEHPYTWAALARLEIAGQTPGYEQRAFEFLSRALLRLPESPRFHYEQGALLMGLEQQDQARQRFHLARTCEEISMPRDAAGRYLHTEFHGSRRLVNEWIARYYPESQWKHS